MTQQTENLIYYGGEVKALGNGRIGGYLVLFGDEGTPDLEGDFFTKDTDFGMHQTTAVLYQHGLDKTLQRRLLDNAAPIKTDEAGVWVEAQLALRDAYEEAIYGLAEEGKLGWSSGTASHLVEREKKGDAFHITRWPLGLDASLTPTPAEPRTAAIPLKSIEIDPLVIEHQQEAGKASGADDNPAVDINIKIVTEDIMPEEKEKVEDLETVEEFATKSEVRALSDGFTDMATKLTEFMAIIEKQGPLKDAGYIAPDDETQKSEVKSFGDWLIAVGRGNTKRLKEVYGSIKDQQVDVGTAGGFLVPEEYTARLLQIAETNSPILPRVTRVPVGSDTGKYPVLDQFVTPTAGAGDTAMAAGITAATTAPGSLLTETQAGFEMLEWSVNKVGGFTQVEQELIDDSAIAVETLLTSLFGIAIRSRVEHYVIRGTGAGEPLGILNSSAAIGVTTATDNAFAWADATGMFARFKPIGGGPVWIIHPGVWPDLGNFEVGTGGAVFNNSLQAGMPQSLLGYPIVQSEHMPQDDNDDVILADLSAYLLFERSGLHIGFSEHFAFTSDLGTYRFYQRLDGMPWLKGAITLADPQGSYTVSPFVYHDD